MPNTEPDKVWATVTSNPTGATRLARIKVPGGWLYRTMVYDPNAKGSLAASVAMAFVPDEKKPAY